MTPSIRTFLLINLLLSITLITSLSIIGNVVLSHKDIQRQLDIQLIHTALSIRSLLSMELNELDLRAIQADLLTHRQTIPLEPSDHVSLSGNASEAFFIEFQVWDTENRLLLRSLEAPAIPFSNGAPGLSSTSIEDKSWRVFTILSPDNRYTIMIAEHANYRQALENRLIRDSIYIMLLSYPFLATLIWIVVGKALHILKRVTHEVSQRDPSHLGPFDLSEVPSEIAPLIKALNQLFLRLTNAFEREKRFTADAAHELKTPLAAISAQAQVALLAKEEALQQESLNKILAGVSRSTHIVQQLLTLNRMLPEALPPETTPIKLAREVEDIAAMLAIEAINKNIDLEFLSSDSPAIISANPSAISILIRNLIDNAIRYTPKGGWVKIAIQETPQDITLTVTDNGPGIPAELRERVFERFYRIIGTKSSGSGLGLSIVQQIAQLYHAKIVLATPPSGVGLEVQVIFPKK